MTCYSPNFIVKRKLSARDALEQRFIEKRDGSRQGWKMMKEGNSEYKFFTGFDFDNYKKQLELYSKNGIDTSNVEISSIPCGCCLGCRLDYSRQWANRCYLESLSYDNNYFLTLTYDDDHLVIGKNGNATLVPDDLKKFMKDLREYWRQHYKHINIRFYACGEYGDTSLRPHYHIILFNCPIPDIQNDFIFEEDGKKIITKKVSNGVVYKWSKVIHDIWKKGNIVIADANWASMAYTARYVMKKLKGVDSDVYDALAIEPEFVRMSRKPGIGEEYFIKHYKEIYKNDNLVVFNGSPQSVQPPRYFDKLVDRFELSDIDLDKIKEYRKEHSYIANVTNDFLSQLSYIELLDVLADNKSHSITCLKRKI